MEVGFDPVTYTVIEGGSTELVIRRRGDAEEDVEVTLSTADDTATGIFRCSSNVKMHSLTMFLPQLAWTMMDYLECQWCLHQEKLR